MDFNQLVEEIAARVAAKLENDAPAAPACEDNGKPRLLILTQEHGTLCHQMLESPRLLEYYQTDCALLHEYQCTLENYEAVILFGLDLGMMSSLCSGICNTPASQLAQKALLLGKKIFVPEETVELLRYADTAPAAYYQHLCGQLQLLRRAGVTICPLSALEEAILSGDCPAAAAQPIPAAAAPAESSTVRIEKRIVTERDLSAVYEQGLAEVHVCKKAIVTDLAREYAQTRRVAIVRD